VGKKIKWKRIEHECEHEGKSKQKIENRTKGFSSTGHVEQDQKPHHAILTGELAWGPRSEVEEVKVKGNISRTRKTPY